MTVRPALIQDGAWTISGMAPGEYQLVAQVVDLEAIAATGTTAGIQATELVMQNVTVTGEDITGIALVTAVGGTARGSIRFEGAAPPAAPASMSSVIGVDTLASGLPLSASGLIKPDWTFEMKGLMGRRKLVLNGAPQGWTIKAVTVDGTDVIDSGIEVNPGEEVSNIEILLTNRAAEVSGHVQDSKGNAVTDFAVVIFASDPQRWGWQSRYVRVARPDQTGRFLVGGLPQGSYLAVALDYVEAGEEANTEFLERLKPLGTSVRLDEGDKKMLTLKLSSQ